MSALTILRSDELADAEEWLSTGDLVERAYTFGMGHSDPRTQSPLRDRYVVVVSTDPEVCRAIMVLLYQNRWCAEYESEDAVLASNGSRMRRWAYIRLGGSFEPNWVVAPTDG